MARSYAGSPRGATPRSAGGRPPKFAEPRRPVTVTLPLRTIEMLSEIDRDRARAIVQATDTAAGARLPRTAVDIVNIDDESAVVIIGPCAALTEVPWIRTVEIAPGRSLISVEPGTSVDTLEVALVDLLEDERVEAPSERLILEQLLAIVRRRRRDRTITKGEILFVPPEPARRRR